MRKILGAALSPTCVAGLAAALLCAEALAQAPGACNLPRPTLLVERFISADCERCWQAQPPLPEGAGATKTPPFVLDWIVPGARGEGAPLSMAALPEAMPRVAHAGRSSSDEAITQTTPLPGRSELSVEVQDGPAFNGYIGLRIVVRYGSGRALPKDVSAWLALVERVPAGSEGTPVERQLVRALVGPMVLATLPSEHVVEHLRAVRVPPNAKPERLSVVGWVETPAGRVLAIAARRDPDCPNE
jgi:hypothetical protein